jgi:hypothetical protein
MAQELAEYFGKPVELFMENPVYAGEAVRCWEYQHCGQSSCPAFDSEELRCWLISGVHCKGAKVAKFPEKAKFCKRCEIIENLVIEKTRMKSWHPEGNGRNKRE